MNAAILQMRGFLVATFLSVVGALLLAFGHGPSSAGPIICLAERINPNSARVASLVRLPEIGLARARAIVVYRDRVRTEAGNGAVFQCPGDLQCIKGIGPKTVADIADCLEFGSLGGGASVQGPAVDRSAR